MSEQERKAFPLGAVVYNRLEAERGETPVKPDLWRRLVEARVQAMPAKCNPFAMGGYYEGLQVQEAAETKWIPGQRVRITKIGDTPWIEQMDETVGKIGTVSESQLCRYAGKYISVMVKGANWWYPPESVELVVD